MVVKCLPKPKERRPVWRKFSESNLFGKLFRLVSTAATVARAMPLISTSPTVTLAPLTPTPKVRAVSDRLEGLE